MAAEGLTITEAPVKLPGVQVYAFAPDAVKVATFPLQMVCEAEAFNTGKLATAIIMVEVVVHPKLVELKV